MESSGRVYTPGQAAAILGVTTQSLRRYTEDYAEVFEPILQHGRQRVFDDVIVERLRHAQGLQQQGVAASIKVGLEMVRDGTSDQSGIVIPASTPFEQAVLERLDALAEMVVQLSEENKGLQQRLTARQLEDTRATPQASESSPPPESPEPTNQGALTRAAMRLEDMWRRVRGRPVSRYPQRRDPKTGKTYYCHRAVAEWHLGRPLEPGEVVHHRDENHQDDHPDNLVVLPNQSVHMRLHWYLRREAQGVQHLWGLEEWLELHR